MNVAELQLKYIEDLKQRLIVKDKELQEAKQKIAELKKMILLGKRDNI